MKTSKLDQAMRRSVATWAKVSYACKQEWYLWSWVRHEAKSESFRVKFHSNLQAGRYTHVRHP